MEHQKIAHLLDDASNQSSKFKTKKGVEVNDESRGACNVNSQIKFKTSLLKSMHTSLLKKLLLLMILLLQMLVQIILIKE